MDTLQYILQMKLKIYVSRSHPNLAITYNSIGNVYCRQGDYAQALENLLKAFKMRLEVYENQLHPDIATSYLGLGDVYYCQKNCEEALKRYQKALDIRLHTIGPDHPHTKLAFRRLQQAKIMQAGSIYPH